MTIVKAKAWAYPRAMRQHIHNYMAADRSVVARQLRRAKLRHCLQRRVDAYGRRWYTINAERQIEVEFCVGHPHQE